MNVDSIRVFCMSLPHATEQVQWVRDLVFKIGGKMFCVLNLEPQRDEVLISFKATDEEFISLQEIEGIIPAPYMARAMWVGLHRLDAVPAAELKRLLRTSYELVLARMPRKEREKLRTPKKKKR
jgi:predicted DNA-binding protein (MmcQ/YjbR family)